MKIEIWSDIMCPFCYIGKRHFEVAKAQVPFRDEIEVIWKSFQLDPTLPTQASGETVAEYLTKRKGMSIEQSQGMLQQITERGKAVGITFNQEKSIPVNTLQAHRMIHFAQANGKASQMEEALFKAYFTDNKNIGDSEVLINLAASIELDKQEAFAQAERLTLAITNVRDELKKSLPREKQTFYGIEITPVSGRQMIQYNEDLVWSELKEKLSQREELLKVALKTTEPFYDNEGCEVPKVSVKYSADSLTVKY